MVVFELFPWGVCKDAPIILVVILSLRKYIKYKARQRIISLIQPI